MDDEQAPAYPLPPSAPRPTFLHSFLAHDFSCTCCPVIFCFLCARSFCRSCCQGHSSKHHPGRRPSIVEVTQFRRDWVVSAEDVDGVGYNWNGIQRVKNHGKKVLYIRRLLVKPQHNMPLTCKCGDRMQCRASFCCIGCRLNNVLSGQRRDVVAVLVATNFSEARLANQFCTICRKSFSSSCCTDHMGCHHPGIEDENNEHVIGIERHPVNGYILTPRHGALADVIFDHIQTLDLEGQLLIAIHRYSHGIIQGTMCPCSRIIALGFLYCSLECKDNHFWN
ncbi:hypothetical protein OsI_32906 [Oryza sativa Indica Group]|uniref:Uncharacterized protein n=2 Tax=Oryza TaxID=4527 RepID=A0A0E0IV81_ORYNI|nr:hypothetical protein OsI_32906 [Oryza sativa Indica Group]